MKYFTLFILLIPAVVFSAPPSTCITCHLEMDDEFAEPVRQWQSSIHEKVGVTCVSCHGGDPSKEDMDEAMDPARGFIGAPSPVKIPVLCGKCHADENYIKKYNPNLPVDQLERYKTSAHGKQWLKGDTKIATCASCHGSHRVLKTMNPASTVYPAKVVETCASCHSDADLMKGYGISSKVVEEYKKGVHAKALYEKDDLSAPTCNDCHGNHGASPPGVNSISFVCGSCHALNQNLFAASPHMDPWKSMELAQCEECHGNHAIDHATDEMLNPDGDAVCLNCHEEGDDGFAAMTSFYGQLTGFKDKIHATEESVEVAEYKGMLMDDAFLLLQEARTEYVKARTAIHTFEPGKVKEIIDPGMKKNLEASAMAEDAFREITVRRKGLMIFLVIALVLALLLWLKIRQMESQG